MKRILIALFAIASVSALAEVDPVAQERLDSIKYGKNNDDVIQTLRVKTAVVLPAGSVSAASLTAGTVLPAVSGASLTNIPATALRAGTALPAVSGASLTNIPATAITPAGSSATFTNIVWNGGATTGNLVFANGRLITP